MKVINQLVLGSAKEQKFVVVLANGETYFLTAPWETNLGEIRFPEYFSYKGSDVRLPDTVIKVTVEKKIVEKFCSDHGFFAKIVQSGAIWQAENRDGVTMQVCGSGLIIIDDENKKVIVRDVVSDYDNPPKDIVETSIKEALEKEALEYQIVYPDS